MKNFWISYQKIDEKWAAWIAWALEQAGYTVILQAWDFRPGSNFVLEMQEAASSAEKTIAVLSPAYLDAKFTKPEWAAAFAKDPEGKNGSLIPIVVEECDVDGVLGQVVHINLIGLDPTAAQQKLLAGLKPGRAKPLAAPVFPGKTDPHSAEVTHKSQHEQISWTPLAAPATLTWVSELDSVRRQGGATALDLHLIPVNQQRLEVRKLAALKDELIAAGRRAGLFDNSEGITSRAGSDTVYCQTDTPARTSGSGLMVTRSGQRGAWFTIPHDDMGSVLDLSDIQPRIESLLSLLLELDVTVADQYSVAIRIAPCMMLNVGDASQVGRRSSVTMPFAMTQPDAITVMPDDAAASGAILSNLDDVAAEIVARLAAQLTSRH